MSEEQKINDFILKLSGKVSLLEPIEVSHNYSLKIEGSVTEETLKDNQDGKFDKIYKFEPVRVELLSPLGKTIKARDPRSKSKLLRAGTWRIWKESNSDLNDEDFYEKLLNYIIVNLDTLAQKAECI
mgnify:FL=1